MICTDERPARLAAFDAAWFVVRDGEIWCWTYRKSQKVKNIERDPRATLLIETGEEYPELRGIQIEARPTYPRPRR